MAGLMHQGSGSRALLLTAIGLAACSGVWPFSARADNAGFAPVYALLQHHCDACHVMGMADGPWSLNTPPTAERFPQCLAAPSLEQLQCATFHQLVDEPAPGIPAWIRPSEAAASEPYAQACDPVLSFHIGHSIPEPLPAADCSAFLRWIEAGAAWD